MNLHRLVSLLEEDYLEEQSVFDNRALNSKYILWLYIIILFFAFWQLPKLSIQFLRGEFQLRKRRQQRLLTGTLPYVIKEKISSLTTQVIFTNSKTTNISICVKVWQREHWEEDIEKQIDYFLEGFIYNQRNAPGVYLGIAYVDRFSENAEALQRGSIINLPKKSKLKDGDYAAIMRELDRNWRLDMRLSSSTNSLTTKTDMKFLAHEVADLHKRARTSPKGRSTISTIYEKLTFNRKRFLEALEALLQKGQIDDEALHKYKKIGDILEQAHNRLKGTFTERRNQRKIKRCHGDLKLTNLWIEPAPNDQPQRLLALDCIDFKPDFCHIDTLSDVAMLVVDLQMHLEQDKLEHIKEFRSMYLNEMTEDEEKINSLLEYYITEKAMVCMYVSILFDNAPENSQKYLLIAEDHSSRLGDLLSLSITEHKDSESEAVLSSSLKDTDKSAYISLSC